MYTQEKDSEPHSRDILQIITPVSTNNNKGDSIPDLPKPAINLVSDKDTPEVTICLQS